MTPKTLQEYEIEVRRLQDRVASLERRIAKIYRVASEVMVHDSPGPVRGRPKRWTEARFVDELKTQYLSLPEDRRSRDEVAAALNISRRTMTRYLERWSIMWPPVGTTEAVLKRLKAYCGDEVFGTPPQAAQGRPQPVSRKSEDQNLHAEEGWSQGALRA